MAEPLHAVRYPMMIFESTGRLAEEPDYDAYIKQLIRQVLLTAPGERINRPTFGAGVRRLVFSPLAAGTASLAQTVVFEALDNWLGEVIKVERVDVSSGDGRLDIAVAYYVRARGTRRYLNVEVTA